MCKITVFTATYNREKTLERLYNSLKKQTFKNFEWIVIDDGSTDSTRELIDKFRRCNNFFEIIYLEQNGLGKHVAMNKAVENARGKLFMSVDSDDFLREDALELIIKYEESIEDKSQFAGVSGLRCNLNGVTIGDKWMSEKDFIDATNFERSKYNLLGDKAEAYYTDIMKKYPMPSFENERFMAEIIWNQIANEGYKIRWFNQNIYIGEYLEEGLTRNIIKNNINNFNGYTYCTKLELNFKQISTINKFKKLIVYCKIARIKGKSYIEVYKGLNKNKSLIYCIYQLSKFIKYQGI